MMVTTPKNEMMNEQARTITVTTPAAAIQGDGEIDVRHLFDLLRSGKWLIIGTALIVTLVGFCYAFLAPRTYESDGLVQVEEDKNTSSGSSIGEISSLLLGTPVQTEAEIEILQSRMVLDQVIEKLNLTVQVSPHYFPLVGHAVARLNKRAEQPISPLFGAKSYAWGGEAIEVPRLEVPDTLLGKDFVLRATAAGFVLEDPYRKKVLEGVVGTASTGSSDDGPVSIFVRDLKARPGTEFFVSRHSRQEVLKSLADNLHVEEQGKQSGVISITFKGEAPGYVTHVVDNIESAYLRQNVERRSADAAKSLEFLETQLPLLKQQVNAAQGSLNVYQVKHGSVDVTKETEIALQNSVDLETQRLQLVQQREQALQRFTAEHPFVKSFDEQISTVVAAQGKQQLQTQKLPTTQQEVLGLMRDLDVANDLYAATLNTVQQLQIEKAGTIGNVRIVDPAMLPLRPWWPKPAIVIPASLFIGLALGIGLMLIQRALLRGVDDPAELEARLGLISYAAIPYTSAQRAMGQRMQRGVTGSSILAISKSTDLAIEALRSLRNSLHFLLLESPNNVVMLTGPSPGLGKSFISVNLAAVLSLSGKRVVVVDADLRRGHLHKYTSLSAAPGLSDYIAGTADQQSVVRPTDVEGLMIVSNGTKPPNPAEILLHERMSQLITSLSTQFDYVIIDSPPSLLVADAAIIGRMAGCTLLVLKSAEHPIREIEETYRRLTQAGVRVGGAIFNQVGHRVGSYGYGGYGYSYYNYDEYK
jgi:tyrosine-protein kinase Etk/Wzc